MCCNWLQVKIKEGVKLYGENGQTGVCSLWNVEQMNTDVYKENVYKEIFKMGIAEKLDEEVQLNKSGGDVSKEEEALGIKNYTFTMHPTKLIVVDEAGSKTIPVEQKMERRG